MSRLPVTGPLRALILLVAVSAALGGLATVALAAYSHYVGQAQVPAGQEALADYQRRMLLRDQDNGRFGVRSQCAVTLPVVPNFSFDCVSGEEGQAWLAIPPGTGPLVGVQFTINWDCYRTMASFPWGPHPRPCWALRGTP